jgi:hypothetical protein
MRKVKEVTYHGNDLAARLGRFVLVVGGVLALVVGIVVTQRLSDDALALVVGLLLAGTPLIIVLAGFLAGAIWLIARFAAQRNDWQQGKISPPIVLQMPAQQQYPALRSGGAYPSTPQQRQWDVIGDDGAS